MTEFSAKITNCRYYCKPGLVDYEVENLEIIQHKNQHFKSVNDYIKHFIDNIKDNVIKHLPNLSLLQINLGIFDNYNILHRLIVTIKNMIQEILKCKERICIKKTIFVTITYENKLVFTGSINFGT
jgi:aspartate carbamoyltransferase regulatory subunit